MRVLSLESHEYVANGNVGGGDPRRSISSNKRSIDQMYILSFKMTFQEIPLIGTSNRDMSYERTGMMEA